MNYPGNIEEVRRTTKIIACFHEHRKRYFGEEDMAPNNGRRDQQRDYAGNDLSQNKQDHQVC